MTRRFTFCCVILFWETNRLYPYQGGSVALTASFCWGWAESRSLIERAR